MSAGFSFRKYVNPVFVETGTFKGAGVSRALRSGFQKIYSIELREELYDQCTKRFKQEIDEGRVVLLFGDSSHCLPRILQGIEVEATFWLDAHYSSGNTARGKVDCPLLEELDAISRHPIKSHTILIDDVRLFGTNDAEDFSNIDLKKVIEKLESINRNYSILYEYGSIKDDVLAAEIRKLGWHKVVGRAEELLIIRPKNVGQRMARFLRRAVKG